MMAGRDREALPIPDFEDKDDGLDDFAPRGGAVTAGQQRAIDTVSSFPSREASTDGQMNLKGPRHILERFKAMCKADRRAYYDMLEILMDGYRNQQQ